MRSIKPVLWGSLIALALVAVYVVASVYFCSGALHGALGGCAIMTGESLLRSPSALIIMAAAIAGLAISLRRR